MINKIEELEVEKVLLPGDDGKRIDDCEFASKQIDEAGQTKCRSFMGNLAPGKMKSPFNKKKKPSTCNGNVKEIQESGEVTIKSENGGKKKWVAAMVVLGVTDLILTLSKFAMCSETEQMTPRLTAGSLVDTSKSELWLPLCIFTIVGTILFFPEIANTLSALFRSDGTTYMSLHMELLITLIFKHVPLATISYFTSKGWSSLAAGKSGSFLEVAVTSSRLMFVSLRIVWYAHMEGIKVKKNDKYELKQVLFMLCCLLFSVTLAVPVMMLKSRSEGSQEVQTKCQPDRDRLWISSTWERGEHSCTVHDKSDEHAGQWKIFDSPVNETKFYLQKCLNVSVCDVFNSAGKEFLIVYECYKQNDDPSTNSSRNGLPELPRICLPQIKRFIFRLYYQSYAKTPAQKRKKSIGSKDNSNVTVPSKTNESDTDKVLYTVAGICKNKHDDCFLLETSEGIRLENDEESMKSGKGESDYSAFDRDFESTLEILREGFLGFVLDSEGRYLGALKPIHVDHDETNFKNDCLKHPSENTRTHRKIKSIVEASWMCST